MMTSTLIDEISDQFLVCQICSHTFDRPKTLKCLHTFCEECLEIRYAIEEQERPYRFLLSRSLSCPICLSKTDLPPGGVRRLPSNAVVTQLEDVIRRRKLSSGAQVCDICSAGSSKSCGRSSQLNAVSKCLECTKLLCRKCVDLHRKTKVTRDHCLFDVQVEKDIECKTHRDEAVRFFCEDCQTCVCVICTFHDHAGHVIFSLTESIDRYAGRVHQLLNACRERSDKLRCQLTALGRCEAAIKTAEDAVRDAAIELIAGVRRRERELTSQLRCVFGDNTAELLAQKEVLNEMLRNCNSTCDLADALLREKSIEFLIVHREITEKLNAISQTPLKDLPDELTCRNVRFAPCYKNLMEPLGCIQISSPLAKNDSQHQTLDGWLRTQSQDGETSPAIQVNFKESVGKNAKSVKPLKLEIFCDASVQPGCEPLKLSTSKQEGNMPAEPSISVDTSVLQDAPLSSPEEQVPVNRGKYSNGLRPPSPRGPDMWVPAKRRPKTPSDGVQHWDSETETMTDTKYTSTVRVYTVDRSTMTTIHTNCDKTTSTDWLVMSRDQETFTTPPVVFNGSVQTESPKHGSKAVQVCPETLNKLVMTRKPIVLERETNTNVVAKYDCEVTARIIGEDKCTSTRTLVTVDTAVGTDTADDTSVFQERLSNKRKLHPKSRYLCTTDDYPENWLEVPSHNKLLRSFSSPSTDKMYSARQLSSDHYDTISEERNNRQTRNIHLTRTQGSTLVPTDEESPTPTETWRDSVQSLSSYASSSSPFVSATSSLRVSPLSVQTDDVCYFGDINEEELRHVIGSADDATLPFNSGRDDPESRCLSEDNNLKTTSEDQESSSERFDDEIHNQKDCDTKNATSRNEVPESKLTENIRSTRIGTNEANENSLVMNTQTSAESEHLKSCESVTDGKTSFSAIDNSAVTQRVVPYAECLQDMIGFKQLEISSNVSNVEIDDCRIEFRTASTQTIADELDKLENIETATPCCSKIIHAQEPDLVASSQERNKLCDACRKATENNNRMVGLCDTVPRDAVNKIDLETITREKLKLERKFSVGGVKLPFMPAPAMLPDIMSSWGSTLIELERSLPKLSEVAISFNGSTSHNSLATFLTSLCTLIAKTCSESNVIRDMFHQSINSSTLSKSAEELETIPDPVSGMNHVDRAVSPVRIETRDCETSTQISVATHSSNTDTVDRVDIGVQSKHVSKCDRETWMLRTILLEKETSTPHVHLLHKNTWTDNQVMVDNQTTMTTDVTAAYLEATSRGPVVRVSRGTCTTRNQTSVDRASSPVRFSCVDKAVLARKGEALEPMDTFPAAAEKSKGRRPFVANRKAKLDCISEGTIEEETEDSVVEVESVSSKLSNFRLRAIQRSVISFKEMPKSFAIRNKISLPVSPRPRKSPPGAFCFDVLQDEERPEVLNEELEDAT